LELHPDRNYGNIEETTRLFAEVQSAYEVLSDSQERAWYDSHRDAILRNEDEVFGGHFEQNMRVTTAEDLVRMFSKFNGKMDFSDSSTGFYSVLRDTFATLAREEEIACKWEDLDPVMYPSFGHAYDDYDTVVKPFYAAWNGFVTRKSFSWKDVYRYPDAPDRRVRHLMEKENNRFREEGIREFNDAVGSLAAFVKKRDPRFKPNIQSEAERQQILRDAVAAQAARSRAANQAKVAPQGPIPEWMMHREDVADDESDEGDDEPDEHVECVVCKKSFKSEKQYEAHERSKRHTKAVQQLRRQMQKENIALDLEENHIVEGAKSADFHVPGESPTTEIGNGASEERLSDPHVEKDSGADHLEGSDEERTDHTISGASDVEQIPTPESPSSGSDDEFANRENMESRILGQDKPQDSSSGDPSIQPNINELSQRFAADSLAGETDSSMQPKLGKAKAKRAKKATQRTAAAAGLDTEFRCAACQAGFPSKTRLFNHIEDLGHAQPVPKVAKVGKGKKR
jgi:DnaJ family protein A protein 5